MKINPIPAKQSKSSDRISELPDPVLGHILSFVPLKQSVQTSALTKRWFHVWTLSLINVDDSTLLLELIVVTEQLVHSTFIKLMSRVFNRWHDAPLLKFALKCGKFDVFRINQWIIATVQPKVQDLDLSITNEENFKIASSLFAYRELVTLKLGNNCVLQVSGTILFPCLKKLHLDGVEFDDNTIRKFLSGSPVLEDLHISCPMGKWDTIVISVPAPRFFAMDTLLFENSGRDECDYRFLLEFPNLEVLRFSGSAPKKGFCFGY